MQKSELFDLVDFHGTIKEKNIPKLEIGKYPDLYRQVALCCVFNDKKEILVQKRSIQKRTEPGMIDLVCGFVDAGEHPVQAAIRETYEETGVQLTSAHLIHQYINVYHVYEYVFVARSNQEPTVTDPTEVEWVEFTSVDELKEKQATGEWQFVADFFENTQRAIDWLAGSTVQAL